MRRKDREITDFGEILEIIKKCDTCRLALFDGDYPYIVPLNFGEGMEGDQLYFYFHCAGEGKKLDLIKKNPKVAFEMDCNHRIILYEERMSCTMGYESVMGTGIMEFVPDEKKQEALKTIMRHFHSEDFQYNTKMSEITTVLRLKVETLYGKRRDNYHSEEKKKQTLTLE